MQPGGAALARREPLSIYVHLPYCARRCPYCDFNTYVVHSIPEERYVTTLLREAGYSAAQEPWSRRALSTVFFDGGTPSLFSARSIGRLLETFDKLWGISDGAEISLEANPGSLEGGGEGRLREFRAAGITRLSFGAQSFHASHLATLGRIHSAEETLAAFGAAARAGIENVSCDLIYAVPGQTLDEWQRDIDTAISLGTSHVSAYCLTYEEGTPMTGMKKAGLIEGADEETELAMFRLARERFGAAGLEPYEISNYARPGHECRHNLAYWSWRDYLGLGAGAHGFASGARSDGESWGRRYANVRLPELYMSARDGAWHASEEQLSREMAISEYMMVGLRLAGGIDESRFRELFRVSFEEAAPRLDDFISNGVVERRNGKVILTTRGLEIADAVIPRLAAG